MPNNAKVKPLPQDAVSDKVFQQATQVQADNATHHKLKDNMTYALQQKGTWDEYLSAPMPVWREWLGSV